MRTAPLEKPFCQLRSGSCSHRKFCYSIRTHSTSRSRVSSPDLKSNGFPIDNNIFRKGHYKRSLTGTRNSLVGTESPHRTSSTAMLPRYDHTVACILKRAAEIQGFIPVSRFELPQLTFYNKGQEIREHYDWVANDDGVVRNREATIFAILDFDCDNCGTTFPVLEVDWSSENDRWCHFFDCQKTTLTTRPVLGSALFWRNVFPNGTGDPRNLHAGMPVPEGFKAGLNIWTGVPEQML